MKDMELSEVRSKRAMKVVRANELIQKSRYSLSQVQHKILVYIISKITPYDEEFKRYTFSVEEFCEVCGMNVDGGMSIAYVREAMKQIGSKVIEIDLGDNRILQTHWFASNIIDADEKTMTITFAPDLTPYLFKLQQLYTSYSLENVLAMKSKYAIRLYELLKSYVSHTNNPSFTLDELRERVDCYKYPNFNDFRRKVLDIAIEEINRVSELLVVSMEFTKTGKKITGVSFHIYQHMDIEGTSAVARIVRLEKQSNKRLLKKIKGE